MDADKLIATLEQNGEMQQAIIRAQQETIAVLTETVAIREAENVTGDMLERWAELPDTRD